MIKKNIKDRDKVIEAFYEKEASCPESWLTSLLISPESAEYLKTILIIIRIMNCGREMKNAVPM